MQKISLHICPQTAAIGNVECSNAQKKQVVKLCYDYQYKLDSILLFTFMKLIFRVLTFRDLKLDFN